MGRKAAREAAMKLIYESHFSDMLNQNALDEMVDELSLSKKDIKYIDDIYEGIQTHKEELDDIVKQYGRGWRLERIARIDLSLLRIALYEIIHRDDIPLNVSINEAVELAKMYSSEKSGSFINGILSAYINDNIKKPDNAGQATHDYNQDNNHDTNQDNNHDTNQDNNHDYNQDNNHDTNHDTSHDYNQNDNHDTNHDTNQPDADQSDS